MFVAEKIDRNDKGERDASDSQEDKSKMDFSSYILVHIDSLLSC